ncbi:SIS domain-containing protein (plasmid) [Photobacterium sp. GJ3]|uniref:SIS domain-containing protein n=1 Tax=Photobacterium sp. GJ3 TaxID=2829502 RepID=UPI001B8C019D|nr:SIS domain-containing protein [Photobacterium sp. GJ3]QUJ70142.1 SIS domain-containing protein [Photobacterium sp. GJ3]
MTTLAKIDHYRDAFSPSEQKIATFILQDPDQVISLSSQQLAQQAEVSQSSIVKFTQKIGFKGFTAFKLAVSEELGRKKAMGPGTEQQGLHNQITREDSLEIMAQKLAQEKQNSIVETTHAIDFAVLAKVVEAMDAAGKIQLVGIGGSALVAKDLGYKLLKIGIPVIAEQDSHVQISVSQTLKAGDVQIVISYSGRRKEVLLAAQTAKAKGAKVIAFTSLQQSPLRELADWSLDTLAEETQLRSSAISSRTAQNTLTDLLFLALIQKRDQEANQLIKDTTELIRNMNA